MPYWLFQGNPQYSRMLQGIQDLAGMHWLVTRYQRDIGVDDRVLLWMCGKAAGIYALAEVTAPAHFLPQPPDIDYWIVPARAIDRVYTPIRFIHKLLHAPLLKADLLYDPVLSQLQVIRAPHNTNFRVTAEEWQRVQDRLGL